MKIEIWSLEKKAKNNFDADVQTYFDRLKHYAKVEFVSIDNSKISSKKMEAVDMRIEEGKLIISKLDMSDFVILLDEKGEQLTSIEFADKIARYQNAGIAKIIFIIGGSFGVSKEIKNRSNYKIALSSLTFPHRMVKLILVEQLYRAFSILKNEKYHHE